MGPASTGKNRKNFVRPDDSIEKNDEVGEGT